ncbi:MAG: hypothetical protein H6722_22645 [Sandaracinus sp.]|nr:hypothetical protein [Myxococcales bacterium]MCB9615244.1 hypothetical protein [Sandaracinus sp.]MCB9620964.1 hypothetical protein [Sandaracinus sp.]MCB9625229.1 hypothetical protein [Sandaracinus sp.]
MRYALLLLLAFAIPSSPAEAQRSFAQVADRASEIPGDWQRFVAPLFERCEGREARACEARRRRDERTLRTGTWLISVPAAGLVEVGPYEFVREGFVVRVPDLVLRTPNGWLTTAAPEDGVLPVNVLAERFFVVPPDRAERFFGRNDPSRLRLRAVIRMGRAWTAGAQRGVTISVDAIQVYNESTGDVLVDSLSDTAAPPGGAERLAGRMQVWDNTQLREARWRAPDGTPVLFSMRVERGEGETKIPVLLETRGVVANEVVRFMAPCCDASLALIPRGEAGVLVIFTERRPSADNPGRGHVLLLEWRQGRFVERARWEGSNAEAPPSWVTDPNAAVP